MRVLPGTDQNGVVWVARSALRSMLSEADGAYPLETGGVLLGYWTRPATEVVVTNSVGPGPLAMHAELGFSPDTPYQATEIERVYLDSGQLHTYLGDWHTHPDSVPRLSSTDRRTLKRIAGYGPARAPSPIMAVLAFGAPWDLTVWRLCPACSPDFGRPSIQRLRIRLW